jgi:four helix bundle protein
MGNIKTQRDLKVWQEAMDAAMDIFEVTKTFPAEEKYSLVDQMRRSSRSVASNISEAWRKRRYDAAFKSKMSDWEAEAGETQTWIELSLRCRYNEETRSAIRNTDEQDCCHDQRIEEVDDRCS